MNKKDDKDIKRSFFRFAAVATAVAVIFLLVKTDNVIQWIGTGITIRQQEREIREDQALIDRMQDTINTLATDRVALERYARERFGFAEPGEDVYIER